MVRTGGGGTLTRQGILEAALRMIDRDGLESFSMRKLGAELGVEAMSLYNHIANKDTLFDGIIELLMLSMECPEMPNATPYEAMWALAHAYRAVLHLHPRVLPLVATRSVQTQGSLPIMERTYAILQRADIHGMQAVYAVNCMAAFIIGHELLNIGSLPATRTAKQRSIAPLQALQLEQYPIVHSIVTNFTRDPEQEFNIGLQAILQGLLKTQKVVK